MDEGRGGVLGLCLDPCSSVPKIRVPRLYETLCDYYSVIYVLDPLKSYTFAT